MNELHREAIVIVGHSDIIASDVDWRRESGDRKVLEAQHLPTLRKGGVTVICDHIGGDAPYGYLPATRYRTSHAQRFMRALDHTHAEISESDEFMLVLEAEDIRRAKQEGKIGVVICLEGGGPLDGELSYLRNYYRLGLRCFGLTHDMRNEIADGIRERNAGGLTHFGVSVVKECNELGILVDVSHLSDKGTEDVLQISSAPITASHSNARALCAHPRNLPDEFIREIAQRGGVIGFHALDGLVSDRPRPKLDDLMRHIDHIGEIGGPDCIAIGPDLMENWDPAVFTSVYDRSSFIGGLPVQNYQWTYPEGMKSNADLPNVTERMLETGYSAEDVRKFLGGNLLRLFEQTWKGHRTQSDGRSDERGPAAPAHS